MYRIVSVLETLSIKTTGLFSNLRSKMLKKPFKSNKYKHGEMQITEMNMN